MEFKNPIVRQNLYDENIITRQALCVLGTLEVTDSTPTVLCMGMYMYSTL